MMKMKPRDKMTGDAGYGRANNRGTNSPIKRFFSPVHPESARFKQREKPREYELRLKVQHMPKAEA